MTQRDDALAFLARVQALLDQHDGEGLEVPIHDAPALGMYSRTRSLLAGGTLLIEAHHSEEALMLGRTLFTESLWLMMLDAAGNERAAYALKWSLASLRSEEGLVRGGVKEGAYSSEESEQLLDGIRDRRRRIQDYQHRHNVGKLRRLGDERNMAAKTERSSEMVTFLLAHQMVHGSDVSHITRRDRVAATGHYRSPRRAGTRDLMRASRPSSVAPPCTDTARHATSSGGLNRPCSIRSWPKLTGLWRWTKRTQTELPVQEARPC